MTKEERKLWYEFFRDLPINVHRQMIFGQYIVDFYCAEKKIAIEIDGSQHFEEDGLVYDAERSEYLKSLGITVIRYSNADVNKNFDGVCSDLLIRLGLM